MYSNLHRIEQIVFDVLAVILVLFYSYSAILEPAPTQYHRGVYVLITYILVFLLYQSKNFWLRILDYLFIVLSIVICLYWILNFEALNYRAGAETQLDMTIATVGVLVGIEVARRVVGIVFVILGTLMILYGVYGPHMPVLFQHPGSSFVGIFTFIFYQADGVFGIMANVLATYVLLFVLFGAFLEKSGAQNFFIDFPLAAVGHRIGGPGKVSVIASAFFGSISGSAIANTVSTGAFTIPLMKRAGFRPHIAGGIEPAASIGGMFMPPIMGAGGFIMAELTGVPYSRIMLVAIFPAMMYFFSVFVMIHYEAKMHNIKGEPTEKSAMEILKSEWFYILPLVLITIYMLTGYSPAFAAIVGIGTCVAVSWASRENRIDLTFAFIMAFVIGGNFVIMLFEKAVEAQMVGRHTLEFVIDVLSGWNPIIYGLIARVIFGYYQGKEGTKVDLMRFVESSRKGAESSLKIGATVGVIGIIIAVLTYSGLILTFADIVIQLADGKLFLTILLIALASLILGMGVPVTAAYLITAVVAVPALTHLGVNEVAAHMIVYWLSQDSNITPPVCIAAFAGATIAQANMWRTAFSAFKFAKFLYLSPFLFGYVPGYSLTGAPSDIIKAMVLIAIGTWIYGYLLSGAWIVWIKKLMGKKPSVGEPVIQEQTPVSNGENA